VRVVHQRSHIRACFHLLEDFLGLAQDLVLVKENTTLLFLHTIAYSLTNSCQKPLLGRFSWTKFVAKEVESKSTSYLLVQAVPFVDLVGTNQNFFIEQMKSLTKRNAKFRELSRH
jgi:hypothetical protein